MRAVIVIALYLYQLIEDLESGRMLVVGVLLSMCDSGATFLCVHNGKDIDDMSYRYFSIFFGFNRTTCNIL